MPITPLYAAILGLVFIALSLRTIRLRRRYHVAIGDGRKELLQRAMRVNANFAEYVPLSLLLIYFVELHDGPRLHVNALGIALICGRLLHAWGVSRMPENFRYRTVGMALTFGVMLIAGILILLYQLE
ncbi:MAG: glutathione metabolism protein [Proteobacteria bacterium]|nr:glutathione metabolism protein [Pseudomonadota bacterium]